MISPSAAPMSMSVDVEGLTGPAVLRLGPTGVVDLVPEESAEAKVLKQLHQVDQIITQQQATEAAVAAAAAVGASSSPSSAAAAAAGAAGEQWSVREMVQHLETACQEVQIMLDVLNHVLTDDAGLLAVVPVLSDETPTPIVADVRKENLRRATQRQRLAGASKVLSAAASNMTATLAREQSVELQAMAIRKRWLLYSRPQADSGLHVDYGFRRGNSIRGFLCTDYRMLVGSTHTDVTEAELVQVNSSTGGTTTTATPSSAANLVTEGEEAVAEKKVVARLSVPSHGKSLFNLQIRATATASTSQQDQDDSAAAKWFVPLPQALLDLANPRVVDPDCIPVHVDLFRAHSNVFEQDMFYELVREARSRRDFTIQRLTQSAMKLTVESLSSSFMVVLSEQENEDVPDRPLQKEDWVQLSIANLIRRKLLVLYKKRMSVDPLVPGSYRVAATTLETLGQAAAVLRQQQMLDRVLALLKNFISSSNLADMRPMSLHVVASAVPTVHHVTLTVTNHKNRCKVQLRLVVRDGVVWTYSGDHLVYIRSEENLTTVLADSLLRVYDN